MISSWALIIAIARSPKARNLSFNVYLIFSILPDAYKNTSGFAANLANLLMDDGSPKACTVIGWNDAYWWCANLWMACIVFGHLRKLLIANKNVQVHEPPGMPQVIKESVAVHVYSMIMASFTLVPVNWIPKATAMSGCEAYPEDGNTGQHIFYWVFFMPLTALIPTLWVTALCFNIWWRELLPVNGKSRSLLFYFARLLLVIYIVTLAVIVSFLFGGWAQAIAFVVFNLVGFFSVCLALLKKDIMRCWKQMWMCQAPDESNTEGHSSSDVESGSRRRRDVSIENPLSLSLYISDKSFCTHIHHAACDAQFTIFGTISSPRKSGSLNESLLQSPLSHEVC